MTDKCTFCKSTDTALTTDYSVNPPELAPVCWDHGRVDDFDDYEQTPEETVPYQFFAPVKTPNTGKNGTHTSSPGPVESSTR
jgi:hypothetical protein